MSIATQAIGLGDFDPQQQEWGAQAFMRNLASNPNYVMTPTEYENWFQKPYNGEDLAALSSGIRAQNAQSMASAEKQQTLGTMFATLPLAAMTAGWAAGLGGAGAGGAAPVLEGGTAPSFSLGAGPQDFSATMGGGGVGNEVGGAYSYNAATGAFEPAAQGAATGGAGAGTGGFQYTGQGLSTLGQLASSGGAGASGMVYDAATGSLVPASAATGTAAGAAASAGTGGGAATGGLFGDGSGPLGLTPLQTLGAAQTIGSLVQGGLGLYGSSLQADAAKRATDAQLQMFNTLNAQGQPYRDAGYKALGTLTSPDSMAYFTHQFGPADLKAGLAPGYDFMLDQGLRATKNAANAQTGLLSGNTLTGVNNYAQQYALNQGYQPSFQNYQTNQNNIFNRLSAIAGLGQVATGQTASAGSAISPGIAGSIQNQGTALGGGFVGAGNAIAGGLTNAASWYALPQILAMGRGG